ncbi:hypothetical protein BGZ51_004062 [Haplosporangium sp. Z 767]|nr:hypothetical protein BGZ51_004062 [Haplosporangium sp. Z 767]
MAEDQHHGADDSTTFVGWATSGGEKLHQVKFSPHRLGPKDVEIDIAYCGVCASDIHIMDEDWCKLHGEIVPGHEIAGTVVAAGSNAAHDVGHRVGATVIAHACLECEDCRAGHEQHCAKMALVYKDKHKEGCPAPSYGGFADRIRINSEFVYMIPDEIPLNEAAPLFCAGVSTFAALRNNGAGPKTSVAIKGIGSMGHLALQFAKAMGCKGIGALVDNTADAEDYKTLGATRIIDLNDQEHLKEDAHKFDIVLVNHFDKSTRWDDIFSLVAKRGTIVILAMSKEPIPIPTTPLVHHEIKVVGSFQGGRKDVKDMLDFVVKHKIHPWIVERPMANINEALEEKKNQPIRYSLVLASENAKTSSA